MPGQAEKEKSKASISNQSSEKLLQLIEFLSEQEEPLRLLDISRQTGMNQSTASRFLSALKSRGYVAQNFQNGKYSLTYKTVSYTHLDVYKRQTMMWRLPWPATPTASM